METIKEIDDRFYYTLPLLAFLAIPVLSLLTFLIQAPRILYRLTLHPLAGFPGPKIAAATSLYTAYYDLMLDGSSVKHLAELHEEYGPIVRIAPNELHIKDLESYNKIYSVNTEFDKQRELYSASQFQGSLSSIPGTTAAKVRRDAYNQYFSSTAIREAEGLIFEKVQRFANILAAGSVYSDGRGERGESSWIFDLSRGFRCMTADIIVKYAYGGDFGGLEAKDFEHPVINVVEDLTKNAQWASYFRRTFAVIEGVLNVLPDKLLAFFSPEMQAMRDFEVRCKDTIQKLVNKDNSNEEKTPTMFDQFLGLGEEKEVRDRPTHADLASDAIQVLLAGMDTTANALVVGTWGILQNPQIHQRLLDELCEAFPHAGIEMSTDVLSRLPYLQGVIKESLRLSYGTPGRLPRIVPASGTTVQGTMIPPGTTVSHSNYVYHADERSYPNPMEFIPDRWLDANGGKNLERELLSFSSGSRECLGMHLANAELLLAFGYIFRWLDLELYETTAEDMEWGDYGVPIFKGHLNVRVRGTSGY